MIPRLIIDISRQRFSFCRYLLLILLFHTCCEWCICHQHEHYFHYIGNMHFRLFQFEHLLKKFQEIFYSKKKSSKVRPKIATRKLFTEKTHRNSTALRNEIETCYKCLSRSVTRVNRPILSITYYWILGEYGDRAIFMRFFPRRSTIPNRYTQWSE